MIESLDKRLTEVREKIRYKQKLEKDLLQIRESLAAEREKCANLEKQLLKEGRDVKKLEGLSLTGLFLTILGSKEAQLEKERQEYLAAKLRYDECRSEIDPLEEKERDTIKQLALLEGLEARYRELLDEKEAVIIRLDWIIQSRIKESLKHVENLVKGVSHTRRNFQQELHNVEKRLAEGYKKRQAIIEECKK